ncbi:hypothetical protein Bca101_097399 [Brassica carinata]
MILFYRSIRFTALQSKVGKKLLLRSGRAPGDIYKPPCSLCILQILIFYSLLSFHGSGRSNFENLVD